MTTKAGHTKAIIRNQTQIFSDFPQMISTGANMLTNQRLHTSITETTMMSQTIYANTFNKTSMCFRVSMGGEISSNGAGDATFILKYGGTTILSLATITLIVEDDIPFNLVYEGHVLTTGATGKIVAVGKIDINQAAAHLTFMTDTANTGATVDLTADGSLNVTADWDANNADCDVIFTYGWVELFN